MSKVDRAEVLKTTKVRTALKTDGSWIHKSKQENDRTESAAEAGPIPAKNTSFVSSAAKKFESAASTESPLNPPLKKTQLTPSQGDSVKKGNVEALAGELGKNIEAQQNKLDPTTAAENKEAHAAAPPDHSDVECSKVSGDANVKDLGTSDMAGEKRKDPAEGSAPNAVQVKPKESSETKPVNATPLAPAVGKPTEPPAKESRKTVPPTQVVAKTVEAKAKVEVNPSPETPAFHIQNKSPAPQIVPDTASKSPNQSADDQVKDITGENSVMDGADKNKDLSAVTSEGPIKVKTVEPPVTTESVKATPLAPAVIKKIDPPSKESCNTVPPKQVVAKTVEAKAKVEVNPSPETPDFHIQNKSPASQPVRNTGSKSPNPAVGGNSVVAGTEKNKDPSEVTSEVPVKLKTVEPPVTTKPVKATPLAPAVGKPTEPPAKESCKTVPPTQVVAKTVEAKAKVEVNPSPETPAFHIQNKSPAPQIVPDTASKSLNQSADTGENKDPVRVPAQVAVELKAVEPAVTTEPVNTTPLAPAVVKPTEPPAKESCKTVPPTQVVAKAPEVKTAPQNSVEPVAETGSKSTNPAVGGNSVVAGTEKNKDPSEVTSEVPVKLKTVEPPVTTKPVKATPLAPAVVKPTEPPAKESRKTVPPTQVVAKTVEVKTAPQNSVEPVAETGSKSPNRSGGDTAVRSAEPKVKSAVTAEPVVKTTPGVAEKEALPAKYTTEQQSMNPVPANTVEVSIKEAVESVTASEGGAAQDAFVDQTIELTDALDEVPPSAESIPEPVNDPKNSHSKGSEPNQSDDTNSTEKFHKPKEELQSPYPEKKTRHGKAVCSFCDQVIGGNVKITFSDPPVTCHSECLKCGVCAKALGDLLIPMYLHDQMFHCKGCFLKALKT